MYDEMSQLKNLLELIEEPSDINLDPEEKKAAQVERLFNMLFEEHEEHAKIVADQLNKSVEEIRSLPYSEFRKVANDLGVADSLLFKIPRLNRPRTFMSPKDKISSKLFEGVLPPGTNKAEIAMENKKSTKELSAFVSVDFDMLPNIHSSQEITAYDREVHDAIVSLYVDGENEYITNQMVYRTMTGDPTAKLTDKNRTEIDNSIRKCSMTRISIESSPQEAAVYGMQTMKYEGNLLYTKVVTGVQSGHINEWIYIMEQPILYRYATSKGQLSRTDINLLNTPVNKNAETLMLQGYLLRRIEAMKHPKYNKSYNILYDTIFKHLKIEAATSGALRKKHSKLRDTIKKILDDWIEKGFIVGYKNNSDKGKSKSLSIIIK
ncbi:hypothetical protein [Kurthia sibirica]|uniref:hypothetical protein n=1 Tax=Kurthia sibirica TaxID=202750 RepID=UPI00116AA744|nr:hypothetical protein [Kurthia sibirica]GEK35453.1 hypothetical protein KSI01_29860 [Kurthia sibirica]